MGEVGISTGENPGELHAVNGDLNGGYDEENDEPMDVDPLESPISQKNNYESRENIEDIDEKSNITEDSTDINRPKDDKEHTQSSVPDDEENLDSDEEKQQINYNEDGTTQQGSCSDNGVSNADDEVHDIPDSDEEESQDTSRSQSNKNIQETTNTNNDEVMDVDGTSNGLTSAQNEDDVDDEIDDEDEEDKPVSIHSDSEDELDSNIKSDNNANEVKVNNTNNVNKNGDCKSPEVQEILSDKEDCIVVEDKDDLNDLSLRRSQRSRKSAVKVRNYDDYDDEDVQEVGSGDPLQGNRTPIRPKITAPIANQFSPNISPSPISIKDARSLANINAVVDLTKPSSSSNYTTQIQNQLISNNKKEPTLVIIDTNSIIAGRTGPTSSASNSQNKTSFSVLPVGVPAQGLYPPNMRTSITPISSSKSLNISTTQQSPIPPQLQPIQKLPQLLPALTDDMFVLEAPSFIVPYIYEKPPSENLKEIITKMSCELEELRKGKNDKKESDKEKDTREDETSQDSTNSKDLLDENNDESKPGESEERKSKKKKKSGDESWDESDTSTDEEASDTEQRTKVLIKEVKEDLDNIKQHIITPDVSKEVTSEITNAPVLPNSITPTDPLKRSENYFESPLGKFFMTIGINLVQEHVQTDLLRQQKRKRDKEGGKTSTKVQAAINGLMKNLEWSREQNEPFKFDMKRCEYCNFKSESSLVMAHHYETPHMKNYIYKCNFCSFETRPPHDILFHMEAVHNIKGRLEKALSYHQCPNCPFEDNGKSKLARHSVVCAKKFRPEINLSPPADWEPPAKIPRIKPKHGLVGTATAYQAMAAQQQRITSNVIPRHLAAAMNRQRVGTSMVSRPPQLQKASTPVGLNNSVLRPGQNTMRTNMSSMLLANNYQMGASSSGQFMPGTSGVKTGKSVLQPSISITPLPRQPQNSMQNAGTIPKTPGMPNLKPGQSPSGTGKSAFVICEICDGYIKDLDQLRNHMQWIHKIKIHPKMIYNRPPLNCQKCQYRFFTDQGLERHLLGSHGLVTSSMQEAANKGKDAGRCPVCGRVYQWKLLNHVSRDHNMTLKPAHLSYKCTVCTATFGMYKQFENHVYSAHSTVAKKSMDNKKNTAGNSGLSISGSSSSSHSKLSGDSLLKPLKINDEITIIPQPANKHITKSIEIEGHIID